MKMPVQDRSHYLRGLLILIRKDGRISDAERLFVERVGASLNFNREFTKKAIEEVLANRHISEQPPVFSSPLFADKFLVDALLIGTFDKELLPSEEVWLMKVATANGVVPRYLETRHSGPNLQAAPQGLAVEDLDLDLEF